MSDPERPDDPDRAAILARRQHFIAIALSGLATTGCASTAPSKEEEGSKGEASTPNEPPRPETPPEACLKVRAPEEPGTSSSSTTTGAGETGAETEGETGETGVEETPPQPCLKKAPPQVCLKKAAPRPCLNVAPSDG